MNETNEQTRSVLKNLPAWTMEHAKQISSVVGLISAAASAVKVLKTLSGGAALLGFPRRGSRHLLGSLALLGAGVAVGTGIGLFVAPSSGAKTLRRVRQRIDALTGQKEHTPQRNAGEPRGKNGSMKNGTASAHHHA